MNAPAPARPLAVDLAHALLAAGPAELDAAVLDKAALCLADFLGAALASRDLPWSRQAAALATPAASGGASLVGRPGRWAVADAAFANGVMGHGLVREDMHAGSFSHLGVVIWPTLLALAEGHPASGQALLEAAVVGYEAGARLGRLAIDPEVARIHRPTGITGPVAAAMAGARLLGLDPDQAASALALAANAACGLNQWAHCGGTEMYFHAGSAARSALSAVLLARQGAFAAPDALDGAAGLLAALGRTAGPVRPFRDGAEILSVYHKPLPVCNFAQTATQAALQVARSAGFDAGAIEAVVVRVPVAAARYPGCDFRGPFAQPLQAKMSIQYCVAAALVHGAIAEAHFSVPAPDRVSALAARIGLEEDAVLSAAFPALQGAQVQVHAGGQRFEARLEALVPASAAQVAARLHEAAALHLGTVRALALDAWLGGLRTAPRAGDLAALLRPGEPACA